MSAAYESEIKERPGYHSDPKLDNEIKMRLEQEEPDIEGEYAENALSTAAALAALRMARMKLNNLTRDTPELDEQIEQARKAVVAAPAGSDTKRVAETKLVDRTKRAEVVRETLARELKEAQTLWTDVLVGNGLDNGGARLYNVAWRLNGRAIHRSDVGVPTKQKPPTFTFVLRDTDPSQMRFNVVPWGKTEVPADAQVMLPAGAPAPQLKVGDNEKHVVISFECDHKNIWVQMPFAPEWTDVTHEHKRVEPGKRVYSKKEVVVKTVGCAVYFTSVPMAGGSVVVVSRVVWRDLYV